jgi:hypothetical protein
MGTAGQRGGAGQPSGTSSGEITMLGHQVPLGRRSNTRVPSAETSTASPIPLRCTVWFDIPSPEQGRDGAAGVGKARWGRRGTLLEAHHFTTLLLREREREREFGLFFMARRKSPIDERPNIRKEF